MPKAFTKGKVKILGRNFAKRSTVENSQALQEVAPKCTRVSFTMEKTLTSQTKVIEDPEVIRIPNMLPKVTQKIQEENLQNSTEVEVAGFLEVRKSSDSRVGGRLKEFAKEWSGAPRWHRKVIERGLRWKFLSLPPKNVKLQKVAREDPEINLLLEEFLEKGAIEKSSYPPLFLSKVKVVPKSNGKLRLILDLSRLNKYIKKISYKLPKLKDIRQALSEGAWMAKVDLEDAYLHIPINSHFQRYLSFQWRKEIYHFTAMPFGLSVAPAVFTGMMNVALKKVREMNVNTIAYLDDWLLWGQTKNDCLVALKKVLSTLRNLGFLVNLEKSELIPQQTLICLGAEWKTSTMEIRLPVEKAIALSSEVQNALTFPSGISRRQLESLLGYMAFAAQLSEECAHRKKLLSPIISFWPKSPKMRDKVRKIPAQCLEDLIWWTNSDSVCQWSPMRHQLPSLTVWTDASEEGWGGHTASGKWAAGNWSQEEKLFHINVLEILAVQRTVESGIHLPHQSIQVYTDNVTTEFSINKKGSTKSKQITLAVGRLLNLLKRGNTHLVMRRVPGPQNVVADGLSRGTTLHTEWEIHPLDWQRICDWTPGIQVDLMATPYNRKVQTFVCPFDHPEAWAVDARTVDWNTWSIAYVFPPPIMLKEVLAKVLTFKGTLVVVARPALHDPTHSLMFSAAESTLPLTQSPRQRVRGQWMHDCAHQSLSWTAFRFSKKCGSRSMV